MLLALTSNIFPSSICVIPLEYNFLISKTCSSLSFDWAILVPFACLLQIQHQWVLQQLFQLRQLLMPTKAQLEQLAHSLKHVEISMNPGGDSKWP